MRVLGIETSCDETAVAVLSFEDGKILIEKNFVSSQIKDHIAYGGVVPELAARKHLENIFAILRVAEIPTDGSGMDLIAVTHGPGLVPALRVGVSVAKTLAHLWGKPIIGVNHLEGHIASVLLESSDDNIEFPALCVLVSGGHTEIVIMRDWGDYEIIGSTRDDAAGEAFDKVAKLLELGYPGGPIISKMAESGNARAIDFPRPMIDSGDYDFSFSGLKTAVRYFVERQVTSNKKQEISISDVCASFQEAVVDVIVAKSVSAVKQFMPKTVILAGGVSANKKFRERMENAVGELAQTRVPYLKYTGDNAAMIAAAGYFMHKTGKKDDPLNLSADPNLTL